MGWSTRNNLLNNNKNSIAVKFQQNNLQGVEGKKKFNNG